MGRLSAADSSCRRARERRTAMPRKAHKNGARHGDSNLAGLSGFVICESLIDQMVELSRLNVGLNLAVPHEVIEFGEPRPEFGKFLGRQIADSLFQLFEFAHGSILRS